MSSVNGREPTPLTGIPTSSLSCRSQSNQSPLLTTIPRGRFNSNYCVQALAEAVSELAISIEHVGSTAVPELAAKPIIDIDIVVDSSAVVPTIIKRLSPLGYVHQGNFGIADREAFASPVGTPAHHLYVCVQGAVALKNHLAIRDCLRNSAAAAAKYGLLKKELARRFPNNIDSYVDGKTDFLLELLREAGFAEGELAAISQANKMCPTNHAL